MKLPTLLLALPLATLLCTCDRAPESVSTAQDDVLVVDAPPTHDRYSFVRGERFGNLPYPVTLADLEMAYGDDLEAGTIYGAEGMEMDGHWLFKGSDNEVMIFSVSPDSLSLEIRNPGGLWYDAEYLIRVGTSLEHLNDTNGKPFIFSGFGWDYGGNPYDWKGGALTDTGFRLAYGGYGYAQDEILEFLGDQPVKSDDPGLENLDVRVSEIYLPLY